MGKWGRKEEMSSHKCCFCGKDFGKYGNNAKPIKKGLCCDDCSIKVNTERLKRLKEKKI